MNEENVKENFIEAVKNHEMSVKFDNGVYRHIRFKQPQTYNQWFEIMTWLGKLAISGNMGGYMFTCVDKKTRWAVVTAENFKNLIGG